MAPIAVGLNGSGIYIGSALSAALGGAVLALGGTAALATTVAIIGLLAATIGSVIRPDRATSTTAQARAIWRPQTNFARP